MDSEIEYEERKKIIVVPGEIVSEERKRLGQNVFVESGKVYSSVLGIVYSDSDTASVVPLRGKYLPKSDDIILAVVINETYNGYIVDINSFYSCFVSKESLGREFERHSLRKGTVLSARVVDVNEVNDAELDDVRVLFSGEVVDVVPVKIPRLIGKQGSMMKVLKEGTGCTIIAGRNGRIWLKNGNVGLAVEAIKKIELESHQSNLTNTIQEFLKKGVKNGEKK